MDFLISFLLGIIQGITEWLPISSTAHLILFESIFSMSTSEEFFEVFKVVIQFGSILAVVVLYFRKLNPWISTKSIMEKRETFDIWKKVIVGSLPLVIAFFLDDLLEEMLSSTAANFVIAGALVVYGLFFIILENRNKNKRPRVRKIEELDYKTALGIGFFQVLAIVPGTSRSGSTILGASILGCSRKVASEFSFFLAIPAMCGASGLKLLKYFMHYGMFSAYELVLLIIGTVVSFIVSVIAIRCLLSYIRKHDFKIFGYYRIILGIVVVAATLFSLFG